MLLGATPLCIASSGLVAVLGGSTHAGIALEERKLPMKFSWVACQPNCRGWVAHAEGPLLAQSCQSLECPFLLFLLSSSQHEATCRHGNKKASFRS